MNLGKRKLGKNTICHFYIVGVKKIQIYYKLCDVKFDNLLLNKKTIENISFKNVIHELN